MIPAEIPSRYSILEEVGQGGMAVVYRARDEMLGREVAIKVLHGHLLSETESKARLQREAQAVAKLQHDNIVQIFDYSGPTSASAYIVTEFIEGQTLKQWMTSQQIPFPELAALIMAEVSGAVAHAHGLGILHRDIKPENVMVRRDGVLKLMDFGVAQVMDLERMTVTGQLIGSPAYMAPELIEGRSVDFRTDVFALGIVLYQLATGSLPFAGRNPHEVFKRITDARYPDPRSKNPLIGAHFTKIIAKALAREPDNRYPTAQALAEDLRAFTGQAGLSEPKVELGEFFSNTEGFLTSLKPRLLSALTESGRQAQSTKRTALALELWNRALTIDPLYEPALVSVRSLEQGQRLRKTAVAATATVVLAAGVYFMFQLVPAPRAPSPALSQNTAPASPRSATQVVSPQLAAAPVEASPGRSASPELRDQPRRARQPVKHSPVAKTPPSESEPETQEPPVTFTLGPTPQAVEVYLDGVKKFDYGPDQTALDVPWEGVHTIEFRKPGFYPARIQVGPNVHRPHRDHITARLQGLPASLVVKIQPPGRQARVLVSSKDRGNEGWQMQAVPGQLVRVRFDPDDDVHKNLVVTVWGEDDQQVVREVTLTPGQKQTLDIDLP